MDVRVEVKNEILGDSIFWEGSEEEIDKLKDRNIVAHRLAQIVVKDPDVGQVRSGMWVVSVAKDKEGN